MKNRVAGCMTYAVAAWLVLALMVLGLLAGCQGVQFEQTRLVAREAAQAVAMAAVHEASSVVQDKLTHMGVDPAVANRAGESVDEVIGQVVTRAVGLGGLVGLIGLRKRKSA